MILFLLIIVCCIGTTMACAGVISKQTLDYQQRYKQVPHIVFAAVYILLMSTIFPIILNLIDTIISIPEIMLIVLTGVPSECYSAAFMLLIALISNTIIMLLALPVFIIAKAISKNSFEYHSFFLSVKAEHFADYFYNLSDNNGMISLRKKFLVASRWLKFMTWAVMIIFVVGAIIAFVLLYVDYLISAKTILQILKLSCFIPMFAYIFLSQLYFFMDGPTGAEELTEFESSMVEQKKTGNYDALLTLYRSRFSNAILNPDSCTIEQSGMDEYIFNEVGSDFIERADNPNAFSSVMMSIKQSCNRLSDNYIEAVLSMMNGKSVFINDTFFGEISIYLTGYLNYMLSSGGKTIVISLEEEQAEQIIETLTRNLKKINDIHRVWRVGTIEDNLRQEVDILVCSALDPARIDNKTFIDKVRCIVIDDPEGVISSSAASDHFADMKFLEKMHDASMQYVFLSSENSRDLEESIEHIINQPVDSFRNSVIRYDAHILVWKEESASKVQYQLREDGPYMGTAYPVLLIAAAAGVSKIGLRAGKRVPYKTYTDVVQASINEIRQNLFKNGAINLSSIVEINNIAQFTEDATMRFLIITDDNNNLLSVARNWCKYHGTNSSFIHIISRPYMLRNYMAENLPDLIRTTSSIRQIVPNKGEDTQRYAEAILISLYEEKDGRPDYEILELYNSHYGTSYGDDQIEDCLIDMVCRVCPERCQMDIYSIFIFTAEKRFIMNGNSGEFVTYHMVKMTSTPFYEELVTLRKYMHYRFGGSDQRYRMDVLVEDIYNYYIPKQIHCFNGELAIVKEIRNGELILERVSPKDFPQYEHIGNYSAAIQKESVNLIFKVENKYSISDVEADLSGEIIGFYEMTDGYKLENTAGFSRILLNENDEVCRISSRRCSGLKLQIEYEMDPLEAVRFEILLTLMFNELFRTMLPNNHNDVAAFVPASSDLEDIYASAPAGQDHIVEITPKIQITGENGQSERKPVIYIFEKSCVNQGIISECRERETLQNIFDILFKYLEWETGDSVSGDRFLQYGFSEWPQVLNISGLMQFLEQVRTKAVENDETSISVEDIHSSELFNSVLRCEYCGRLAIEHIETTDNRIICARCNSQIVERQQELNNLYKTARKVIQDTYLVNVPVIRSLKFKSRDEIMKYEDQNSDEITIGRYIGGRREIWVERHAPKMSIMNVLIHEMVHAWQDVNLKKFTDKKILEGHAQYVAIELLRSMKEELYADYWVRMLHGMKDQTSYEGYLIFVKRCKESGRRRNPFDVAAELTEGQAGV